MIDRGPCGDQFGDRAPPSGDYDLLAALNVIEQTAQFILGFKSSYFSHLVA
jgi:hypothetical protein